MLSAGNVPTNRLQGKVEFEGSTSWEIARAKEAGEIPARIKVGTLLEKSYYILPLDHIIDEKDAQIFIDLHNLRSRLNSTDVRTKTEMSDLDKGIAYLKYAKLALGILNNVEAQMVARNCSQEEIDIAKHLWLRDFVFPIAFKAKNRFSDVWRYLSDADPVIHELYPEALTMCFSLSNDLNGDVGYYNPYNPEAEMKAFEAQRNAYFKTGASDERVASKLAAKPATGYMTQVWDGLQSLFKSSVTSRSHSEDQHDEAIGLLAISTSVKFSQKPSKRETPKKTKPKTA